MSTQPLAGQAAPPPDGDEPEEAWRRLNPLGIIPAALRGLRQLILPLAAAIYGGSNVSSGIAAGLLIGFVFLAVVAFGTWLGWRRTRYRIGTSDIRFEKGVISRQARSVPFERIQDVSLEQGPVARLLGLVEVRFETGAGGKDELKLAYVGQAEGEALRETVRARLDAERAVGGPLTAEAAVVAPGDVAAPVSSPLFVLTVPQLLLFGLFEFSLILFAVLGGAAEQIDFLLPFDIWELDEWERRLGGPGDWLGGLGLASRVVGAAIGLAFLAAVGVATGVVRTVLRDYGFILERTPKGFRRRRGLLTRTDVVMPVHRVQALRVTTGLLRRIWGWHRLDFISLAQDAGSAHHTVAPFAQMDELAPIAAAAGLALPATQLAWQHPSERFRTDRAFIAALVPLPLAIVALALGQPALATLPVLLALLLGVRQLYLWRNARHALEPTQIVARTGWLRPSLTVASRAKLHSVEIVRGPLARRRNYADVVFGLAGGRLRLRGLELADARHVRDAVLDTITALDFSQLPR